MELIDLTGRKALIFGVANKDSLAWWAAKHLKSAGADVAMTYLNDKAKPHVEPLAVELGADFLSPCNVAVAGEHAASITGEVIYADAGFHVAGMVLH